MKEIIESITINETTYKVVITKKFIKNMYFRFKKDVFHVSCPFFVTKKSALKSLAVYANKLIKPKKVNIDEGSVRIFGAKEYLDAFSFEGEVLRLNVKSEDDFYSKIKMPFLKYLKTRVEYFEKLMEVGVKYNVRVQRMSTRLGSNSRKTLTLNFSTNLVHYSKEAIDSVIIHELAHHFYFDHSDNFYGVVFKYCTDYTRIQKEFKE